MATTNISFCAAQTIISAADVSDGDAVGCFCLGALGHPGGVVDIVWDPSNGVTDNLRVKVRGSVDGTTVDNVPVTNFEITVNATDPHASFQIEKLYWFQLDLTLSGTPSDQGLVTAKVMPWEFTSA